MDTSGIESKKFSFSVGQLKKILSEFPNNMPVVTSGRENGFENFYYPETVEVRHKPDTFYTDGEFQIAEDGDKETFHVLAIMRVLRDD